ncbi:addiction module antitoxin RelB [Pseudomonas sp. Bc-h]|uniref:type II toxin-antitoxin system RelE/ParE family toxin n=1 Tax=Pseudomonas sp. Bc-h TaxID=1943632 RepID=UPI0009DB20E0|nr:type II toxin-antitoxin system RelE/ParE family toxin [Pseudomonas sp. Bc-h]OQR32529.1 addiction module antitoxin RelB [Pseudomonas sp. Bc-h]
MYTVLQTEEFANWHSGLRNLQAKLAIVRRIDRAAAGNLGDFKSIGGGIPEMRLDIGGYRIYFTFRDEALIVLLAGGDKSSQSADIRRAQKLGKRLEHE